MIKVYLPTAGKGTRMGVCAKYANKAILPVNFKALFTHIVEKFPLNTEYVVALGYLKEQVVNYIEIAHPKLNVTFVEVDNYDGKGSGPGYSLKYCSDYLQEPFYFVACDTLWHNELDFSDTENWLGVSLVNEDRSDAYCNFQIKDGNVVAIKDKQKVSSANHLAFVGLCYINDYRVFWDGLSSSEKEGEEFQIASGLEALIKSSKVKTKDIDWTDIGTYESYKAEVGKYENYDFSKTDEFLYIFNKKVIKFFANQAVTDKRVFKANLIGGIFPKISDHRGQFYAYSFLPGKTMYSYNSPRIFKDFLIFMKEKVWKMDEEFDVELMSSICKNFYFDKTNLRIAKYKEKYPNIDENLLIKGIKVPQVSELLDQVPWNLLYKGLPSFMHGDLHFDNILTTPNNSFILLDWRHEFGGQVEVGDLYYDLGKLAGGLLLNYDFIKLNLIEYSETSEGIEFDFASRHGCYEYSKILEKFVIDQGFDLKKVQLLVPLIYLNMAPLHHYPFDKLLFSLGKLMLFNRLNDY